jgi:transaldolase
MNPIKQLLQVGQSAWLDFISRKMLREGELDRLVHEDGVRGLTSNPSIFQKAIADGTDYHDSLIFLMDSNPEADSKSYYEAMAVEDIQIAADAMRHIYDESSRMDGMVSLEVSPHLAHDTRATIMEARHLWKGIRRPNAMIKIPATPEGIPAIETCTAEGININVTLIFSLEQYEQVAAAYIRGLAKATLPSHITSVASFFVSRIDAAVDAMLEKMDNPLARDLLGKIAVANSKVAYRRFSEIFAGGEFAAQRKRGGRVQRMLFGSTSTKNPSYSDVKYVEEMIGPDTINTMPPETLRAFQDHGKVRTSLLEGLDKADEHLAQLASLGIDLGAVTDELQQAGVASFAEAFDKIIKALDHKRRVLMSGQVYR